VVARRSEETEGRGVELAVSALLGAIESRNWRAFEASLDLDAVIFLPGTSANRVVMWRDVKETLAALFEGSAAGPPMMRRRPQLAVRVVGDNAFVSFHLQDRRRTGKRALVMDRHEDRWLVRHLHTDRLPVSWPGQETVG
jgi:hypothetical protein